MVDLKQIVEQNSQLKETGPEKPVGIFVGGTSGLGRATAYEFVKNTRSPTVYVVGRNEASGEELIEQMKKANSSKDSKYYFLKHDTSSIKDCDKLCSIIRQKEQKVNLLYISSGILSVSKRTETDEGIETRLATNYYGRWRIVDQLVPLVQKAADKKEFSRVVSVMGAGEEGKILTDDLGLKEKYSFFRVYRHFATFNSLAVERFSKLYPDISFSHIFPGFVANTNISRNLPWPLDSTLKNLEKVLATPLEDFAARGVYLGASGKEFSTGGFILDENFKDLKQKAIKKGYLTPELESTVWKHTKQVFEQALNK